MMEQVILVDEQDNQIGTEEKLEAHKNPKLHRAVSVVIINDKNEMLIHKRASTKYHCPGLWTNACCTHPKPNEDTKDSAVRRLKEEMGIDFSELNEAFTFTYKKDFDNGLTEWEFDHTFVGKVNNPEITPNPEEVDDYKWINMDELKQDISNNPDIYTYWFKVIVGKL
ncbi:isopentenyl-diphosphate Delta-isomerase [Candidatus Woesearchaeota archaeon]|nr:isopentenyl-diphosphate Delta-isomerase [Candidatus Woesearchaeota archaeon]MBT5272513.1 isopentenyl-diphosphate Delta-isomerase [Candidatus Woesearchaeota archaeon]MBT6041479.1 isopentenyl-diphosphate Delta-isomerase [Candidatus Woesearchaeota archaeon]MBT6336375.1 isopentenyl-diphosphate Delta-isomerase [Candidatus Woesearchaeota archaeon]MBT7927696.1 isopentenyl-diphosphate Delta-isomerase [Candidatus Woesearchaeota archaeon]